MQGKASASSRASSRSTTSRLTPEWPRARPITLVAIASRTTGRREILAEPAAVRHDQIALKLGQPVVRDPGLGEQAEAGIDPVDGPPALDDPADAGRGGVDRGPGVGGQLDRRPGPDGAELGEGDGAGAEEDHAVIPAKAGTSGSKSLGGSPRGPGFRRDDGGAHDATIGRSSPCSRAQSIASS